MRQAKKVGPNSPLYGNTKISDNCLNLKNVKIPKRAHAFKGYASSFNVHILNSFIQAQQQK